MPESKDIERLTRALELAMAKRTTAVSQIRGIHEMAGRVAAEPAVAAAFSVNAADLDGAWTNFRVENDSVLESLVKLGRAGEYSAELPFEIRTLVNASKAVATSLIPKGAEAIDLSYIEHKLPSTQTIVEEPDNAFSRLPEIPLPVFDGDFRYWPTFRDSFTSLVDKRPKLSNIHKMYYLIGSLRGPAAEAARGIPLSADNYALLWSTLSARFHRPRLVAASLIDKLLQAPVFTQESHHDLNSFACLFSESLSLLSALKIPDMGSFIMFSIAFRCLPVGTRKLFESTITAEYPSIKQLIEFAQSRAALLELVGEPRKNSGLTGIPKSVQSTGQIRKVGDRQAKGEGSRLTSLVTSKPVSSNNDCPCCAGPHVLAGCTRFKSWPVDERSRWTRDKRLCYVCFSSNHWAPKCKSKTRCTNCSRRHHVLLHPPVTVPQINIESSSADASLCAATVHPPQRDSAAVLLGTALVHVRDRTGSWHTLRALVDCASQISAVTVAAVNRLGIKPSQWTTPISGLAGVPVLNVQGRVNLTVQPRFATEPLLDVHAWVLPSITGDLPRETLPRKLLERYSNLALADPAFNVTSSIDMLLGGDVYATVMDGRKVTIDSALPTAFSSVFGWILIGPLSNQEAPAFQSLPVSLVVSIESLMEQFWQVEEPAIAPASFTVEGQCEQIFHDQVMRLPSGRFSVPLPFHAPASADTFHGSRKVAERRFELLERKLSNNSILKSLYTEFMSEYIALGHMSLASSPGSYFIPHHAIYRPEVDAKKIRVVFDASARGFRGPSLNDCLFRGPKLQQDLIDILIRFRVHKYVFTTDICKMYRQILVLPEYRTFQHILWRASPHAELQEYELNTVTYGVNCAPFLALRVLQCIASDDCEHFRGVRQALECHTYVDDICDGADTIPQLLQLQSDLILVLQKSGIELKKWASNTPSVLDAVPTADRACVPTSFDTVDGYSTRVLGLEWHPGTDHFCCALNLTSPHVFTKRGVLSVVARIFDPLGVFAPTVLLAKFIMQRTWLSGVGWDDPLPSDIQVDWDAFTSELPSLLTIRVPRYINTFCGAPCFLLGFCDASQRGYAAVVYIRVADTTVGDPVFLIGAKTKVAPIKTLTIPRLELNAASLLARWLSRVKGVLASQLNIIGVRAWSDSTIVLSWLTVPHQSFKVYVSNRVHQIHNLLPDCRWQYVDSTNNPADCASRGITPSVLAQHELYWRGPDLIYGDPTDWDHPFSPLSLSHLPEVQPVSCAVHLSNPTEEWFARFSDYDRMRRVVAYILRFIALCRRHVPRSEGPVVLCKRELDAATRVLIIESQRVHLSTLLSELSRGNRVSSKPLARLSPFIDSEGVIRVGGRLRHSFINYDCKHPVLIAKRSIFASMLCRRWHLATGHAGPRVLTVIISRQYWVISLRSVLHHVITGCVKCVRLDAKPPSPLMADLPATRVRPKRPFSCVGVDYAGPLQMRELRLRKSRVYKVYIAVFVCFTVKAVHLEVVSDLSTDAFLAAFDRFVARRGLPSDVYSDCGTNFVGANKLLRALIISLEGQAAISNSRACCNWHFNPPSAPHFGGLWEAAVRSTKRLLIRIIGTHVFTYEEFTTILCRVEAVLNSRPLTPTSTDPHDLDCLTPGHFLIGQPLLAVPPRSCPDAAPNLNKRWKLLDQCHQAFWRRWSNEYLTTLQERSKWTADTPSVNVNDMVIIVDNQSPPLTWRLGRVIDVVPGSDGRVRVARVLTRAGEVVRPVVKLVRLPNDQHKA
ncbi:Integrase catalytic domain-containing protein, partial [Aphis craccivora]